MTRPASPGGPLLDAAHTLGLLRSYVDESGRACHPKADALVAVAGAVMGNRSANEREVIDRAAEMRHLETKRVIDAVVVIWQPGSWMLRLRPGSGIVDDVVVTLDPDDPLHPGEQRVAEVGGASHVDLADLGLPIGRHRVEVRGSGLPAGGCGAMVVVAPRRLPGLDDVVEAEGRPWGLFAPVWSAWTTSRPEVHLGALDAVGAWSATAGASLVGTLPLLATFADSPCDPSPYSPVSRRRWNEALVDLVAAPGFADNSEARALAGEVVPTDPSAPWDPVGHWSAVRRVLGVLAEQARLSDRAAAPLEAALAADPELASYAWFRAEVERTGTPWRRWGSSPAPRPDTVRRHPGAWRWAWSQWVVGDQLADLAQRFAARRQVLYLDLALGAHADGFDTWVDPGLFGWGASVGAPPDRMFGGGQDWGFPPQRPAVARESGHEEWARALRAHFSVSGVLRLDHVLGLQRLFWIPDGGEPRQGVYVRQPLEELLAVLAVEAHRRGAAVVGEDLGTVDPGVRTAMAEHGIAGMYIAQFAVPAQPRTVPSWPRAGQLAAANTHDMPTFCGWLTATDAVHRQHAGLLDAAGVEAVGVERATQIANLGAALGLGPYDPHEGPLEWWHELFAALVGRLGASAADAVLVALDDLVGGIEQQNVPGTPWWRPNWVVRLPVPLEQLAADPVASAVLNELATARRAAHTQPEAPDRHQRGGGRGGEGS